MQLLFAFLLLAHGEDLVLNVQAPRRRMHTTSSSQNSLSRDDIKSLPQGENISLPKLLSTTTAGIVEGAFGQTFIRGSHAGVQYQIDGVQLPESPANSFGDAFSPRNIERMEVITGGVPAQYGERLAAVVNIVTKVGPEEPGGSLDLAYGSYNTLEPWAVYGGSTADGRIHYFASASFVSSDRGLDTPQPINQSDQSRGGREAIHDKKSTTSEFFRVDYLKDNSNKFSVLGFDAHGWYQIPNYPDSFQPTDRFFQTGFVDQWQNGPFRYLPAATDDAQNEDNSYLQLVWKHTLNDHAFLQLAPYVKYSYIKVSDDPERDLWAVESATPIIGATATAFSESRATVNYGLKLDVSDRLDALHNLKTGMQVQSARADGSVRLIYEEQGSAPLVSHDDQPASLTSESVYLQDDYAPDKNWAFNVGLRFDAVQTQFGADADSSDSLLQPRLGASYMLTDALKAHVFYGKLFQPAPAENLRSTFVQTGQGNALAPHDVRPEKDDYYEVGVEQEWLNHRLSLTWYYKNAVDMLDDSQVLNTSVAQPYNFAEGYAHGVELSIKGQIDANWSDFFNYSDSTAKGRGVTGGLFAFKKGEGPGADFQYLDHVQLKTASAGLIFSRAGYTVSVTGLYGSGLRTGPNNSMTLPAHTTADVSFGYRHRAYRAALDLLNVTDQAYPISVANGYNGSHYAAGATYALRVGADF